MAGAEQRKYLNPPVVGVTVGFDIENPGWPRGLEKLHRALADRYDDVPILEPGREPQFPPTRDVASGTVTLRSSGEARTLALSKERIAVGTSVPYEGWSELVRRVDEAIEKWTEVFPETKLLGLSLSFQNVISVPSGEEPQSLVPALLRLPRSESMALASTYGFWSFKEPDSQQTLTVVLSMYSEQDDGRPIISLDITSSTRESVPAHLAEYRPFLEGLRLYIIRQFEAMITDRARQVFGEKDG